MDAAREEQTQTARSEETEVPPAKRPRPAAPAGDVGKLVPVSRSTALRSVLKVFVMRSDANYAQPWQMRPQRAWTGSAFVVDTKKRHIITNAHVVTSANTVHVRRPGNPKKWRARVLCEGKICDLALLTVEDAAFWTEDLQALTFVSVPELQDEILVAGYPKGGDSLSITKGIVSRVVMTRFTWATSLLGIQIDAAINSGNSGGPAFASLQQGHVAGVAFAKISNADNVGYIIPDIIVRHFLAEYERHGRFRGCCSVGFRWQNLENAHLRKSLGVAQHRGGCLVYKLDPMAPAESVLRVSDVVLEVEGVPVADDGTVQFRNEERVDFSHIVRGKHIGETLQLLILRDGQETNVAFQVQHSVPLVPTVAGVDCVPSYFIIGGLVFIPLTVPFLDHGFGKDWRAAAPSALVTLIGDYREEEGQQVVLLFQILAAELNFGYKCSSVRLLQFNGTPLRNLAHLASLVDSCTTPYMKFDLEGGRNVILDRAAAIADGPTILQQHAIAFDRSIELREATRHVTAAAPASDGAPAATENGVAGTGGGCDPAGGL